MLIKTKSLLSFEICAQEKPDKFKATSSIDFTFSHFPVYNI